MKPINRQHHLDNFYSEMGKRGAKKRWSGCNPREEDTIERSYFDRKGAFYGSFSRKDGVTQDFYFSIRRKDQLDVFERNVYKGTVSKRTVGCLIFELV